MTQGHKIQRRSLPETLFDSLRERVLNGEFKEGDPLIQDAIAKEYDVSRIPVREALRQLEAAGLVVMQLHKGAIVSSLPAEEIAELFELRALLEGDLLARAVPRMTGEQLHTARDILTQLEASYGRQDVASWGRLNWAFHHSLYVPAGRVQTLSVVQSINMQTDRYVRMHLSLTGAVSTARHEHRELLRLCSAHEAKKAVAFLREHIAHTGRELLAARSARRKAITA